MGFCLINNVAVAAAAARAAGAARVAIVDWDVHHGNGTQEIFWRDPSVLYASVHQYPFYPGTGACEEIGEGPGRGTTVNVPLPAGMGPPEYERVFAEIFIPALDAFAPDIIVVSAGYDAHRDDPLARMELDAKTYAMLAAGLAGRGRLVVALEGGYDLQGVATSTAATVEVLLGGAAVAPRKVDCHPDAMRACARTRAALAGTPIGDALERA
jgi:acetoin utilization deacetylase AcuC-like enzyme